MKYANDLRNVYNSGFESDGLTLRADKSYHTFSAFALAGNGRVHATMEDRSIVLLMKRKLDSEKLKSVRDFDGWEVRAKCARFAHDNLKALEKAKPRFPRGITDRLADTWGPLLAIADECAGKWPDMAREAALALSVRHDDICLEEILLRHIKEAFADDERLFSRELVQRLIAKADAPWASNSLNEWTLADKLSGFDIRPKTLRKGDVTGSGYYKSAFAEAWQRWK